VLQRSIFDALPAGVTGAHPERIDLGEGVWVDVARGFLAGADEALFDLMERVQWRVGRRQMYDREVDDPRLSRWFRRAEPDPHPLLAEARVALEERYHRPLSGVGLNLYRDGRDSVAFHADRELRDLDDSLVAIVTLGQQRPFLLRPRGGGRSHDLAPASGDLLVMGGRCQATWEHAVPKSARSLGPRLSASWRWSRGGYARPRPGGYFESRTWRTLGT
jgi:alkylated DNA repair dioxygenase AlkB